MAKYYNIRVYSNEEDFESSDFYLKVRSKRKQTEKYLQRVGMELLESYVGGLVKDLAEERVGDFSGYPEDEQADLYWMIEEEEESIYSAAEAYVTSISEDEFNFHACSIITL